MILLLATCESPSPVRSNPFDYLADVVVRVQDHLANTIDELLPGPWAAANGAGALGTPSFYRR